MIEFNKRLRILAEEEGYEIAYGHDGGLSFSNDAAVLRFNPTSKHFTACSVAERNESFKFDIPKEYVFDVFLEFCHPRTRARLKGYQPGPLLTLQDYIDEEGGQSKIDKLRQRLMTGPVERHTLGGNRILVEYRSGLLVIADDLMTAASNVIEFP